MRNFNKILLGCLAVCMFTAFNNNHESAFSLKVEVKGLQNSKGSVQYALYNTPGSIPDESFKKTFRILTGTIVNGSSQVSFKNLPPGIYAVNILHDENNNGKIDKGLIFPKEGIGFSNYQSIGLKNRPDFSKAGFEIKADTSISVKVIYM
jgi:uncharacterized protein (DUF2141 family)